MVPQKEAILKGKSVSNYPCGIAKMKETTFFGEPPVPGQGQPQGPSKEKRQSVHRETLLA